MENKKAIMGIYWVVTAAIALIILLFMIYIIKVGAGGGITDMLKIQQEVTNDLEKERMVCENLCNQARSRSYQNSPIGFSQWRAAGYCSRAASIDLNGDGEITAAKGETNIKCWDTKAAFIHCSSELGDDTPVNQCSCLSSSACDDDSDCGGGTPVCDLTSCICVP